MVVVTVEPLIRQLLSLKYSTLLNAVILEKCTTLQKLQDFIQNHVWGISTSKYSFPLLLNACTGEIYNLAKTAGFSYRTMFGGFPSLTTVSPYLLEKCTTLQKPETVQGFIQNHVWGVSTPNYSFPPKFSVSYETLLNDERVKLLETVQSIITMSNKFSPKTLKPYD